MNLFGRLIPPWAVLLVGAALGAALAGGVQQLRVANMQSEHAEYRATAAQAEADARAEALAAQKALYDQRDAHAAEIAEIESRLLKEKNDAVAENTRRMRAVAAGAVRVRYVAAQCPSPDLPTAATPGSVGDGAGIELAPAAGLDVLDLREALIRDRAKIEYLQGYIRKITKPVGLGLRAPHQ
jgi:hypothetical protein